MSVRAKFLVESVTNHPCGGNTVKMRPVHTDSKENKSFWQATPSGNLEMYINNPNAATFFASGAEYYIDFTQVDSSGDSSHRFLDNCQNVIINMTVNFFIQSAFF
ncbi:hypothetical protein Cal7507_4497 [Calothrix sp. PCC 7507]|nr:hypothetical protein Cal7507_4497 [Calothrix sp. PCC 7507]